MTGADCFIDPPPRALRGEPAWLLRVVSRGAAIRGVFPLPPLTQDWDEGYTLRVWHGILKVGSNHEAGLVRGIQTLRQLFCANLRDGGIPCVEIEDWPSLRYRGFSDDITRGPNPTLETLEREVRLSALLKMNSFTYYLEHQFAYAKHPEIGPKDGSLTPEELKALIEYAKRHGVEVIGNQQSFGHFAEILKHDRYKPLAETTWVLNPTNEGTYQLLDDLYSEQAPLTESAFFNVCCDETDGLGTGPSRAVAEKIGVGGLYARHIRRIHDILRTRPGPGNRRTRCWRSWSRRSNTCDARRNTPGSTRTSSTMEKRARRDSRTSTMG
jgi:hexosaminidase